MNLVIDIGNTRAKLFFFQDGKVVHVCYDEADLQRLQQVYPCERGIVSAGPLLTEAMEQAIEALPFPFLHFSCQTPVPVTNAYKTPDTLGPDRLAAAAGAAAALPDANILAVDAGTCLTCDLVDASATYLGGNISPGIEMRLAAMKHFTNTLPLVGAEGDTPLTGNTTETALRSGAVRGMVSEIEGYFETLRTRYAGLQMILTGGDAGVLRKYLRPHLLFDEYLVAKGLNLILEYNKNNF